MVWVLWPMSSSGTALAVEYFDKAPRGATRCPLQTEQGYRAPVGGQQQAALDSYHAYLNTVPDSDEKKKVRTPRRWVGGVFR